MKRMGKKQFIGGPLTAVLAVAAGYLFGPGPALILVWVGFVYFFAVPLGLGRKASGSVGLTIAMATTMAVMAVIMAVTAAAKPHINTPLAPCRA